MMSPKTSRVVWRIRLLIAVCLLSFPAYGKYGGGTGEPNDPYQIATAEDLIALGEEPNDYDKHFILTADIDLDPNLPAGTVFETAVIAPRVNEMPFPDGRGFTGSFNGNHCRIKHLTIRGGPRDMLGLFGKTGEQARIFDLGLEDVSIKGDGSSNVGALAGLNHGYITHCYSNGSICSVNRSGPLGGLVGHNDGGSISKCYSDCEVSGRQSEDIPPSAYFGGLVGLNWYSGTISKSYATGAVSGDYVLLIGGLVGGNQGAEISNCYATGAVTGTRSVGGLAGDNAWSSTIRNCFAIGRISAVGNHSGKIGGLIGETEPAAPCCIAGIAAGCFWDVETTGVSESAGGTGLTTAQMQTAATFFGWGACGNEGIWTIDEGNDYPRLSWENQSGEPIAAMLLSDFVAGNGTENDPYLIYTAEELNLIGLYPCDWDRHFVLMADIDLSAYTGTDFNIIGYYVDSDDNKPFTGVFDGNGHTVTNFSYTCPSAAYTGLFGYVEGPNAGVKNLALIDASIDARFGDFVGSLVGYLSDATVTNCSSTGTIIGYGSLGGLVGCSNGGTIDNCCSASIVTGNRATGGLLGYNGGAVTGCYSTGAINAEYETGGLVGCNEGTVTGCYSTGTVSGGDRTGGLAGGNYDRTVANCYSLATITECYSTGNVTGHNVVGGLVGSSYGTVTGCYSTGTVSGGDHTGGLVGGCYYESVIASFWDIETSGQSTSDGGTGKTTTEMQSATTFLDAGWDFVNVWGIGENQTYPYLRKYSAADIDQDEIIDFGDLAILAENWLSGVAP